MEIEKRQVIEDLGHWTGDGLIRGSFHWSNNNLSIIALSWGLFFCERRRANTGNQTAIDASTPARAGARILRLRTLSLSLDSVALPMCLL